MRIEKINFIYKYTKDGGWKKTFPIPFFLYRIFGYTFVHSTEKFSSKTLLHFAMGNAEKGI